MKSRVLERGEGNRRTVRGAVSFFYSRRARSEAEGGRLSSRLPPLFALLSYRSSAALCSACCTSTSPSFVSLLVLLLLQLRCHQSSASATLPPPFRRSSLLFCSAPLSGGLFLFIQFCCPAAYPLARVRCWSSFRSAIPLLQLGPLFSASSDRCCSPRILCSMTC